MAKWPVGSTVVEHVYKYISGSSQQKRAHIIRRRTFGLAEHPKKQKQTRGGRKTPKLENKNPVILWMVIAFLFSHPGDVLIAAAFERQTVRGRSRELFARLQVVHLLCQLFLPGLVIV